MIKTIKENEDMAAEIKTYRNNAGSYTPLQFEVEGVNYISVPVIMMTPGVRAGSRGALLHTEENLGLSVNLWNGKPVVINHPKNEQGVYISAAEEGVRHVGTIVNAEYRNGLRATLNLNADILQQEYPHVYASVLARQPMEVSIGAFSIEDTTPGIYGDKPYVGTTVSYSPDHLAILPNAQGACSRDAGCGIRVNESNNKQKKGEQLMNIKEQLAELHKEGFGVYNFQVDESLLARLDAIRSLVDSWDSEYATNFLRDLYDDNFIYEKRLRRNETTRRIKFYKQTYTVAAETGEIELQGEPIEVIQKTEYMPIQANKEEQSNNKQKGEQTMAKTESCCPQKVEELIVNVASKFTEQDREFLNGLDSEQLEKVTPKEVKINVNEEHVKKHLATYTEVDKVIALLPETIQVVVNAAIVQEKENRKTLIASIQANTKDVWEEAELEAMQTNQLVKIEKSTSTKKAVARIAAEDIQANSQSGVPVLIPGQE